MAAAAECGQHRLTAEGLAALAGCSPALVCKKLKNPEFRQLFITSITNSLVMETPAILHTFTEAAKEGSFKHGKMILEITGVYQEKQRVELGGKIEVGDSPFKDDDERISFLKATVGDYLRNHNESTAKE